MLNASAKQDPSSAAAEEAHDGLVVVVEQPDGIHNKARDAYLEEHEKEELVRDGGERRLLIEQSDACLSRGGH